MWGYNARRFQSLNPSERENLVLENISFIHPHNSEVCDGYVDAVWDVLVGGGTLKYFAPGEQARYQDALLRPLPNPDHPKVFFAGEHVGIMPGWSQSALLSGATAAAQVLAAA
jgi:monoamine oxidase